MLTLRGRSSKVAHVFDATWWRRRAEQMRAGGNEASNPVDKERFLNFAADFEQLSERATAFTDKRAKT